MSTWDISDTQDQQTSPDTAGRRKDPNEYWTETAFRCESKETRRDQKEAGNSTAYEDWGDGKVTPTQREATSQDVYADNWDAELFREDPKPTQRKPPVYEQTSLKPMPNPQRTTNPTQYRQRQDSSYSQSGMRPMQKQGNGDQWSGPQAYRRYAGWGAGDWEHTGQKQRREHGYYPDYGPMQAMDVETHRGNMRPRPPDNHRMMDFGSEYRPMPYTHVEDRQGPMRAGRTWDMSDRNQSFTRQYAGDNGRYPMEGYPSQGDMRYSDSRFEDPRRPPGLAKSLKPSPPLPTSAVPSPEYVKNSHSDSDFYTAEIPINTDSISQDSHFRSDRSWDSFGLPAGLLKTVKQNGYEFPSKIQEMGFELLLTGEYEHVVVQAPTGSGKTLAFVLPTLALIDPACILPQVLVLAPTMELLNQLTTEYSKYAEGLGMTAMYMRRPGETIGAQVVLMTPRQGAYLLQTRTEEFSRLKFVVLDEADHLLDKHDQMEFAMYVSITLKQVPSSCHILCFSATFSDEVRNGFDELLGQYSEIMVRKEDLVLENIKMYYAKRGQKETKLELLMRILDRKVAGVTLIFVNTVKFAQVLGGVLARRGSKCALLIGRNITIDERLMTTEDFKRGFYDIVVSTNLLARGIDNTRITRVINFDIPNHWTTRLVDTETYLHRIGRAGRFSRAGEAITMVGSEAELKMVEELMSHYGCVIEPLPLDA